MQTANGAYYEGHGDEACVLQTACAGKITCDGHGRRAKTDGGQWLKEHEEEIENLKAIELDALREACWMMTQARIERLSARLEHITAELDKRDFSDVPMAKLVELEMKTRAELAREFAEPRICSERQLQTAKAERRSKADSEAAYARRGYRDDPTLLLELEESGNGRKRSRHAE